MPKIHRQANFCGSWSLMNVSSFIFNTDDAAGAQTLTPKPVPSRPVRKSTNYSRNNEDGASQRQEVMWYRRLTTAHTQQTPLNSTLRSEMMQNPKHTRSRSPHPWPTVCSDCETLTQWPTTLTLTSKMDNKQYIIQLK